MQNSKNMSPRLRMSKHNLSSPLAEPLLNITKASTPVRMRIIKNT